MTTVPLSHEWAADQWDWPLQEQDGLVKVVHTKEKFEVGLAVRYFAPNEIEVKVIGQDLVVHCNHDERTDSNGVISRTIHRTYRLPEDVDPGSIKSHLTKTGILSISGSPK